MWPTISTSASGAASSAASTPPGRGASTWVISSARRAIRSRPSLRSRAMAFSRRPAVKLPPSGKITNASFWSRPVARAAICDSRSSPDSRVGRDEARRDPPQHHVDRRVPREGVLQHHARLAGVPVQQGVHQDERVARPRVAAHHEHRSVRHARRVRPVGADPQREHAPGLAEEDDQRALDEVVVDAGEVRRPDPPAEAARDPQAEHHREQQRLEGQVDDHDPEQPQRPPPARQERRQRRGADQPQRQGHPDRDGQADHRRRDDEPAQCPGPGLTVGSRAAERVVEVAAGGGVRRVDAGLHAGEVPVGEQRVVA